VARQFTDCQRAVSEAFHNRPSRPVGQGQPGITILVSGHEPLA
jgi:hypothetical protein